MEWHKLILSRQYEPGTTFMPESVIDKFVKRFNVKEFEAKMDGAHYRVTLENNSQLVIKASLVKLMTFIDKNNLTDLEQAIVLYNLSKE